MTTSSSGTASCRRPSTTTCFRENGSGCTRPSRRSCRTLPRPTARPDLGALGRLAYHWHAAHEDARALAASVNAGRAARRFGAPEAVNHLERVLEVWDQVPDPTEVAGVTRSDVLCWLALLVKDDNKEERSIRLIREAIQELGPDPDPLLASRVYSSYGQLCHAIDDVLGQREAVTLALEYAEGEPSEELARALFAMAGVESDTGALGPALAVSGPLPRGREGRRLSP